MDIIPLSIDGAIVLSLDHTCHTHADYCDACSQLVLYTHNWMKQVALEYAIFDFLDEKYVCPTFIEELLQLRKRLKFPFLFAGAMEQARRHIERFNYHDTYPLFVSPEDAIRALRIQHPGITESARQDAITFNVSVQRSWKAYQEPGKPGVSPSLSELHGAKA